MDNEYAKMDAGLLHLTNKKVLLKLIKQKGQISRSELTKITGLTPPSIARIVGELVEKEQLVEYLGVGNSSGGRPPQRACWQGCWRVQSATSCGKTPPFSMMRSI